MEWTFDKLIDSMIEDVYLSNESSLKKKLNDLVNGLSLLIMKSSTEDKIILNKIMSDLINAITNSDYLLFSDLLLYELSPITKANVKGE